MKKERHEHDGRINYDRNAADYAAHRRIHRGVFDELCERALLGPGSRVLEVGCGTGNYTRATASRSDCRAVGLDPATGMLAHSGGSSEGILWVRGRAEYLALAPASFDLVFSVDVIHHITDRPAFYRQAARVLRPGGQICTTTDSADIIRRREILSGYFPETVDIELARYPRLGQLEAWMAAAGLSDIEVTFVSEPYLVTSAQPFRDRAYSSLHLINREAWLVGLEHLESDLVRGPIPGHSRYACLWGRKATPP